jgi:hypothetical protein
MLDSWVYWQILRVNLTICALMGDFETRRLALTSGESGAEAVSEGLADVFTLHRGRTVAGARDERAYFFDTLAEYQWARDTAGLMPNTIDQLVKPVIEVCEFYDLVPWRLVPRDLDRYFAGPGKQINGVRHGRHDFTLLPARWNHQARLRSERGAVARRGRVSGGGPRAARRSAPASEPVPPHPQHRRLAVIVQGDDQETEEGAEFSIDTDLPDRRGVTVDEQDLPGEVPGPLPRRSLRLPSLDDGHAADPVGGLRPLGVFAVLCEQGLDVRGLTSSPGVDVGTDPAGHLDLGEHRGPFSGSPTPGLLSCRHWTVRAPPRDTT